eukprot:jgi/Botrbrau1/14736/Bobra.0108s0080.1
MFRTAAAFCASRQNLRQTGRALTTPLPYILLPQLAQPPTAPPKESVSTTLWLVMLPHSLLDNVAPARDHLLFHSPCIPHPRYPTIWPCIPHARNPTVWLYILHGRPPQPACLPPLTSGHNPYETCHPSRPPLTSHHRSR